MRNVLRISIVFIMSFIFTIKVTAQVTENDSLALVALYDNTDGANWTDNTNWKTSAPVGEWYGITVDAGRVTEIILYNNRLSGTIPAAIGDLNALQKLYLNNNRLSGTIPAEIGSLSNLQMLALDYNQLNGSIPEETGNLGSLEYLALNNNSLSGTLPAELGDLSNLTSINVRDNQLSGEIPSEIGSLSQLQKLYLNNNQLSGSIPVQLGNLTDLNYLYLYDNQLSGTIPTELGNLSALRHLYLKNNQLSGEIPAEIGNLSNLQSLDLMNNDLSGAIPSALGNLSKLNYLSLADNQLDGAIPPQLGNLSNLTRLNLKNNQFSGAVPDTIRNLTKMMYLYLDHNKFESLPDLSSMSNLRELYIDNNALSFKDIEPNVNTAANVFRYSPQDSVGEAADRTVWFGDSVAIPVNVGGSANVYQWMKDGADIDGANSNIYIIPQSMESDSGSYICKITNTIAAELTLYSRVYKLHVKYTPLKADSLVLVALYDSTNGDTWTNKTNWKTDAPLNEWYGITVDSNRVTQIKLDNNQLNGTIPSKLGNLNRLQILYLHRNQLHGIIPPELGSLNRLRYLYLYSNQLSGTIPAELGDLSNLQRLFLHYNQLNGSLPAELGNLSNLQLLYLYSNRLSGSLPAELGNLSHLQQLSLSTNQFSGTIPEQLYNLSNLLSFSIAYNRLSGELSAAIGNLSSLRTLYLQSNMLSGTIPAELGDLSNLTQINLSRNQFNGTIPPEIGNLTNLKYLSIEINQLSGAVPDTIRNLTSLENLYLYNNNFNYLPDLSPLSALKLLYIDNNAFSFEDIEPNINVAATAFRYAPQAAVGEAVDTLIFIGNHIDISVITGGEHNIYQWYRDGVEVGGADSSVYTITSAGYEDAGDYVCKITNSVATDLTLFSYSFRLRVAEEPLTADSLALVALYDSTDGDKWINNTNWKTNAPLSEWYGVTVDSGRVTELKLNNNNLSGRLPDKIGNLSELKDIFLSDNHLKGSVPESLIKLSKLNFVLLENNALVDLPDFSSLSALSRLWVKNNKLTFEDLEVNMSVADFSYIPQDSVGEALDTLLEEGISYKLSVEIGGNYNHYQWFKNGQGISGADSSVYEIASVSETDSGEYICAAVNDRVPDLTIYSRPLKIRVKNTTGIGTEFDGLPKEFTLEQNYPNPFNPITKIGFALPEAAKVTVTVYNILGQRVALLLDAQKSAGYHSLIFNAADLSAGLYLYEIKTEKFHSVKKMLLVK